MHVHDDDRPRRLGMPEAVLSEPKTDAQLIGVIDDLIEIGQSTLLTRLPTERFMTLPAHQQEVLDHDGTSATAVLGGHLPRREGRVAIAAAGTSDLTVAAEAARTLSFCGVETTSFIDIGVAGLWRLEARLEEIRDHDIVIAVAGMDAALVSVLGGLVAAPIVAVPTSVGYGVAAGGEPALHSALASCAQGVTVVNIDNGFGAACAAVRMLSLRGA